MRGKLILWVLFLKSFLTYKLQSPIFIPYTFKCQIINNLQVNGFYTYMLQLPCTKNALRTKNNGLEIRRFSSWLCCTWILEQHIIPIETLIRTIMKAVVSQRFQDSGSTYTFHLMPYIFGFLIIKYVLQMEINTVIHIMLHYPCQCCHLMNSECCNKVQCYFIQAVVIYQIRVFY